MDLQIDKITHLKFLLRAVFISLGFHLLHAQQQLLQHSSEILAIAEPFLQI
jgi:hypothetical protein